MLIGLKTRLFEGTGAESLRDTSEQAGVQGNYDLAVEVKRD